MKKIIKIKLLYKMWKTSFKYKNIKQNEAIKLK